MVKKLEKMRRKFLWQGNKEGKGYCLVKWDTVLLSKKDGGLGIRNIRLQNESLLLKWLWRCINEDKALWKEVIVSKYGEASPWCTKIVTDTYGVGVWRTIRNLWQLMEDNICLKVGNGAKTKFWRDRWFDQTPLKEAFPDLFLICVNPEVTIQECWSTQGWDISFRRRLNDWEIERVALIPTKVKCFTWLVIKRACLTQEVLQKKKRQLVPRCFLCMVTEETNKHLFLHCKYTAQLWNLFLNITGYSWAMPEHTSDLLSCWMKRGGNNKVQLELKPNEKHRIRVKCKSKILCRWEIYASTDRNSGDFIVKKYHPFHRCPTKNKNKLCTSVYVAHKFQDRIVSQPNIKLWEIQELVRDQLDYVTMLTLLRRQILEVLVGLGQTQLPSKFHGTIFSKTAFLVDGRSSRIRFVASSSLNSADSSSSKSIDRIRFNPVKT
ncbi:hypothetical protein MTR67_052192 [Solanum verrucosum]|uniref:Reverse transcriptase zinc-binding domain-containing protein n=1 Tax=Solanum verrucosum TaxID=315347 RepID=A0AAF0V5R9_SOLVR|nr:hypothetical protein MTR67_052192 [Solanum verrucosum]